MLDALAPDEMQAALAVVQEMRVAKSAADYEKALLDAGDWQAIKAYASRDIPLMQDRALVPWRVYKDRQDMPHFWRINAFRHYKEPHDLQPVFMVTPRSARLWWWKCCGGTAVSYGARIWQRWARMTKLTAFTSEEYETACNGNDRQGRRYGSNKDDIGQMPVIGRDGAYVWLRGQYVHLERQQYDILRAMRDIISKTRDLDKRVAMMRQWRTENLQP